MSHWSPEDIPGTRDRPVILNGLSGYRECVPADSVAPESGPHSHPKWSRWSVPDNVLLLIQGFVDNHSVARVLLLGKLSSNQVPPSRPSDVTDIPVTFGPWSQTEHHRGVW